METSQPEQVLQRLGLPYQSRGNRLQTCCPFHDDRDPSAGFYLDTKLFHCYACELTLDVQGFYAKVKGISRAKAMADLGIEDVRHAVFGTEIACLRLEGECVLKTRTDLPRKTHAAMGEKLDKLILVAERGIIPASKAKLLFERWKTNLQNLQ